MKHYVIATAIVLSVFFFTLMDASPWITVGFVGIFTTMLVFHCDRQQERQTNLEERIDEMAWAEEQIARLNKGGLIGSGPGEENAEDLLSVWDIMSNDLKALTEPKKTEWVVSWIDIRGREHTFKVHAWHQSEAFDLAVWSYQLKHNMCSPFGMGGGVYQCRVYRREETLPSFDQHIRNCNPPQYIELESHDEQMTRLTAYQNGVGYHPKDH